MKKIVVAGDSFKGSLSSVEFGEACRAGILRELPDCCVDVVNIADGGEGTAYALTGAMGGIVVKVEVCGPAGKPVVASYGMSKDGTTAYMDMAQAAGLTLVAEWERSPMKTTTYGVGQMIKDACVRGCKHIMLGIGGSATNDAGLGMMQALGARFYNADGEEIAVPATGADMCGVKVADLSDVEEMFGCVDFTVACDVDSPFYGPQGAAYVFSAQKGATPEEVEMLDGGLRNMSEVILASKGVDVSTMPGAGAAGGLGGALRAYLGARLVPGIDFMLEAIGFEGRLKDCDLVITGEGRMDAQSLRGKAPYGIMEAARRHGVPTVALCGSVNYSEELLSAPFRGVLSIQPMPLTLEEAMDKESASFNLAATAAQVVKLMFG